MVVIVALCTRSSWGWLAAHLKSKSSTRESQNAEPEKHNHKLEAIGGTRQSSDVKFLKPKPST